MSFKDFFDFFESGDEVLIFVELLEVDVESHLAEVVVSVQVVDGCCAHWDVD